MGWYDKVGSVVISNTATTFLTNIGSDINSVFPPYISTSTIFNLMYLFANDLSFGIVKLLDVAPGISVNVILPSELLSPFCQ